MTLVASALPTDIDGGEALPAAEHLAECKLGYDCSPSGPVYQTLCNQWHDCSRSEDVADYYRRTLNPHQYQELDDLAGRVGAGLQSQTDNWPEAQLLEQQLAQPENQADQSKE